MKTKIVLPVIIAAIIIGYFQLSGCSGKNSKSYNSTLACEYLPPNTETDVGSDNVSEKSYMCSPPIPEAACINQAKISTSIGNENFKTVTTEDKKNPSKIIKTARVSMRVKNIKDSRKAILDIVKKCDAYVSSDDQTNNTSSIEDDMVIRIKTDGFDDIIDKLLEQSIYTDYKKVKMEDVTTYYIDNESRLKSKKEVETRYKEILAKATTVTDIIGIEEKLGTIREEIEATEGVLKYLNDQVTYSTIKLHFYEKLETKTTAEPESGFFYKIGQAFKGGWEGVQLFFIGLINMWPLWLVIFLFVFFIVRFIRRWRRKRRDVAESK